MELSKMYLLLLGLICLVSFSEQVRKKELSLGDRWQQMSDLSYRSHVINLDSERFRSLVRSGPRNYSTIVMFTAMDSRRGCAICREANDEYMITATSHRYSKSYPNNVFFAMVDFDKGSEVFQSLKINTAPMFLHFPAKGTYRKSDVMDIQRTGISAEILAKWVETMTDVQIRVIRPPNYAGTAGLLLLMALFGFLVYLRRNNLEFLYNKTMWAVMALFFSFSMTSGQMWNHIRGPPFMQKGKNGGVSYIAGGSQSQLVVETYIVIVLSALSVSGMILMIEAASTKSDVKKRRIMAIVGLAMLALFFSLVLSIFRSKAGGYPYSFLIH